MATKKTTTTTTSTIAAEPSVQPALTDSPTSGESASADELINFDAITDLPTKCAIIDANNVYQGMVDLPAEGDKTDRHLIHINECDLPTGEYTWDGSCFHPIKARAMANVLAVESLEASIKVLQKNDVAVPVEVLIWLSQLKKSVA